MESQMTYPHTEIIKESIQANLKSGTIGDVVALPKFDADGEPIVEVLVCILSDIRKIDGYELASLTSVVRQALSEKNVTSFPIMRYMNKRDWTSIFGRTEKNEAA
jgi:hypothetical protein